MLIRWRTCLVLFWVLLITHQCIQCVPYVNWKFSFLRDYVNWNCGLKTQFHQLQNYNQDYVLNPRFQLLYVRMCSSMCAIAVSPFGFVGGRRVLKYKSNKCIEQTWHCHLSLTECNKIHLVKAVVQMMNLAFSPIWLTRQTRGHTTKILYIRTKYNPH